MRACGIVFNQVICDHSLLCVRHLNVFQFSASALAIATARGGPTPLNTFWHKPSLGLEFELIGGQR